MLLLLGPTAGAGLPAVPVLVVRPKPDIRSLHVPWLQQVHEHCLVTSRMRFPQTVYWGMLLTQEQIKCLALETVNTVRMTWHCYNLVARHTFGGEKIKHVENLSVEILA